jgi:hypothetical protein
MEQAGGKDREISAECWTSTHTVLMSALVADLQALQSVKTWRLAILLALFAMGLTLINFTPGTRSNADYTGEADTNFVSSQAIFDSIVNKEREDPHGLNGFILLLQTLQRKCFLPTNSAPNLVTAKSCAEVWLRPN